MTFRAFVIVKKQIATSFFLCVCPLIDGIEVITLSKCYGSKDFDNVVTSFIINNRTHEKLALVG